MTGTYMEISTAHIKEETAKYLDDAIRQGTGTLAGNGDMDAVMDGGGCGITRGGMIVYPKDGYGYFIPLTGEEQPEKEPEDLAELIHEAQERGCGWIILDGDAEEDPELPVYAWEGGME